MTKVVWYGTEIRDKYDKKIDAGLRAAATFLQRDIQRSMKAGGGQTNARRTGPRKGGGAMPSRSKPGEVPFVQTGRLRQSIYAKQNQYGRVWRVGTNLAYGIWLELGTRPHVVRVRTAKVLAAMGANGKFVFFGKKVTISMKPRPYIRPAVARNRTRLRRIIAAGKVVA